MLDHAQIIKGIRDLPALPPVVAELIRTIDSSDTSIGEVAAKVARDQALAAKALRLANSSFYGLSHKVRTIQQAITVVGFDSVRAMITAVGIIDAFVGAAAPGLDLRLFWQHAIATGLCAKHLARAASLNPDDAFISGLLHDIGTLVLATRFPEQLAAASAYRIARGCSMLDAERAAIGTDHAAIGRLLAEHWKFPLLIRDAIGDHHAPLPTEIAGPCVVHLADAAVHALGLAQDDDERVPPLCAHAWQGFSLSAGVIHQVLCNTESEFEEACQILAV